ncbi:hypothetical protein BN938_1945 [Mucinivorans hirudinis]|uniref:NfeD-like C-terminal domain-containing protein n=1 Tax=Mucinivorans hirudinis TaxID=1433126 RepID=A0A060RD96_9BACT|nr:hypothetical protein BN938_1945 [Mucinivorans hirudinis]
MGWIILLIVLGILLFAAELILLPGITVAAIGSFCALAGAVYVAFTTVGQTAGWVTLAVVVVILSILTAIFLRSKTWRRVALNTNIENSLDNMPRASVGDEGRAITRLAPMGKILINNQVIEVKTMGEYVDEGSTVEVVGTDNMNLIVKLK